jgi:hypothetical protein
LTGTMRFANGSGSKEGFVVAVAMICLNPFLSASECRPPEEVWQLGGQLPRQSGS